MKITYGSIDFARSIALDYKKNNPNAKIIDIGGTTSGWSKDIVNLVVDIIAPSDNKNISLDICVESQWQSLLDIVEKEGKFDLCICTHTLEDLYNPFTALEMMPKISKSGIISMPSFKHELTHKESNNYYGYFHHRWLFHVRDNRMLIVPKLESIRQFIGPQICPSGEEEVCFEWVDKIDYDIFMENYLGPDISAVESAYKNL